MRASTATWSTRWTASVSWCTSSRWRRRRSPLRRPRRRRVRTDEREVPGAAGMKKRNDVPPSSVSEAAPVDALTAMTLERDKALAMAQRIGDQSDQRIAKLLDKL